MNPPFEPPPHPLHRSARSFGRRNPASAPPSRRQHRAPPQPPTSPPSFEAGIRPELADISAADTATIPWKRVVPSILLAISLLVLITMVPDETGTTETTPPPVAASSPSPPNPGGREAIRQARAICTLLDRTGVTTSPCAVGAMTITLHAILEVEQAREICASIVRRSREANYAFGGKWKFDIRTPFSGGQSIAWCRL